MFSVLRELPFYGIGFGLISLLLIGIGDPIIPLYPALALLAVSITAQIALRTQTPRKR